MLGGIAIRIDRQPRAAMTRAEEAEAVVSALDVNACKGGCGRRIGEDEVTIWYRLADEFMCRKCWNGLFGQDRHSSANGSRALK